MVSINAGAMQGSSSGLQDLLIFSTKLVLMIILKLPWVWSSSTSLTEDPQQQRKKKLFTYKKGLHVVIKKQQSVLRSLWDKLTFVQPKSEIQHRVLLEFGRCPQSHVSAYRSVTTPCIEILYLYLRCLPVTFTFKFSVRSRSQNTGSQVEGSQTFTPVGHLGFSETWATLSKSRLICSCIVQSIYAHVSSVMTTKDQSWRPELRNPENQAEDHCGARTIWASPSSQLVLRWRVLCENHDLAVFEPVWPAKRAECWIMGGSCFALRNPDKHDETSNAVFARILLGSGSDSLP